LRDEVERGGGFTRFASRCCAATLAGTTTAFHCEDAAPAACSSAANYESSSSRCCGITLFTVPS
jgi:hypothetical protein